MGLATTLYHLVEKNSFTLSHCWLKLNGKPKWSILFEDPKNLTKKMKNMINLASSNLPIDLDEDDAVAD